MKEKNMYVAIDSKNFTTVDLSILTECVVVSLHSGPCVPHGMTG